MATWDISLWRFPKYSRAVISQGSRLQSCMTRLLLPTWVQGYPRWGNCAGYSLSPSGRSPSRTRTGVRPMKPWHPTIKSKLSGHYHIWSWEQLNGLLVFLNGRKKMKATLSSWTRTTSSNSTRNSALPTLTLPPLTSWNLQLTTKGLDPLMII